MRIRFLTSSRRVTLSILVQRLRRRTRWLRRSIGLRSSDSSSPRRLLRSMLTIPLADGTNPTAVTQAIKGALQSDKAIDGIFTLGSAIALDALKAVDQVGRTGKVTIGTTDLSNADLEAVQQGKLMFVIDQQPYLQGFDSVEIAVQYIRYGVHPIGPVITGPLLITNANVAEVVEKNKAHRGIRRAM